jgi:hypothetical protein
MSAIRQNVGKFQYLSRHWSQHAYALRAGLSFQYRIPASTVYERSAGIVFPIPRNPAVHPKRDS